FAGGEIAPRRDLSSVTLTSREGKSPVAASNINSVVITGNLTRDPELRQTPSGTAVCGLRVAVNSRRKEGDQWVDKPNYFDVTVWGAQGENCANYLSKGRPVAIEGRLDWREWEAKDGGKRQAVQIIANTVQFLGSRDGSGGGGNGNGGGGGFTPQSDVPADMSDFGGAPASSGGGGSEDDIPF
ncbi:MAG TPA: single-stranded DNA-binding protein, partial [Solirubrobacterales bacterium]|nr:single-stranded DNA-binding protein [Solirubrobacterales bacterium]